MWQLIEKNVPKNYTVTCVKEKTTFVVTNTDHKPGESEETTSSEQPTSPDTPTSSNISDHPNKPTGRNNPNNPTETDTMNRSIQPTEMENPSEKILEIKQNCHKPVCYGDRFLCSRQQVW